MRISSKIEFIELHDGNYGGASATLIDSNYMRIESQQLPRRTSVAVLCGALLMLFFPAYATPAEVTVELQDDAPDHVHIADAPFDIRIKVDYSGPGIVKFHWQDFSGKPVTSPRPLETGRLVSITAPSGHTGYLGLVLAPATAEITLPNRQPGEAREYGLAVLPQEASTRLVDTQSRFGMVHADLQDPYLRGWIKTMTWKTTSSKWWGDEMEKRRSLGLQELPVVVGDEWKTDDNSPVTSEQLGQLHSRVRRYFAAHPATEYWETGIEENLRHRYQTPYYWENLSAKARAVRDAADDVNPNIQLIYQIAELRPEDAKRFLQSEATDYYAILSLHPYAWPDFPDPEEWLEEYLESINRLIKDSRSSMSVWLTEVGVPHHGNYPGEFFGYPEKGARVTGKTHYEAVLYLIKIHVMAFHLGVEKIFWYNYKDRNPQREYAENHFGLRDYWGFPKPVYVAYLNLQKYLDAKQPGQARRVASDNVRAYDFHGQDESVTVVWSYPGRDQMVSIDTLFPEYRPDAIIDILDPMGAPVAYAGTAIPVSKEPIFIIYKSKHH